MEQKVLFEKEICAFLSLPSIPKKEWDKKSAFNKGVAVVNTYSGQSYAVASFNPEKDSSVRIVKVFGGEMFDKIEKVFVVPAYMNKDTKNNMLVEKMMRLILNIVHEFIILRNMLNIIRIG